ncbi:MAG TPA: hypothetical protein VHE83_06660 [Mycobacteriales bacterium]|nr:hypothetical protein [Mycobacteriales bacterium]
MDAVAWGRRALGGALAVGLVVGLPAAWVLAGDSGTATRIALCTVATDPSGDTFLTPRTPYAAELPEAPALPQLYAQPVGFPVNGQSDSAADLRELDLGDDGSTVRVVVHMQADPRTDPYAPAGRTVLVQLSASGSRTPAYLEWRALPTGTRQATYGTVAGASGRTQLGALTPVEDAGAGTIQIDVPEAGLAHAFGIASLSGHRLFGISAVSYLALDTAPVTGTGLGFISGSVPLDQTPGSLPYVVGSGTCRASIR